MNLINNSFIFKMIAMFLLLLYSFILCSVSPHIKKKKKKKNQGEKKT